MGRLRSGHATALLPAKGRTWTAAALAKGVCYEVPPQSLGLLVLSPQPPAGGFRATIREADVRQQFAARQAEAQASGDIAIVQEGKLTIDWADMDGDGNAEVHVASAEQELAIGPSGNLWSWQLGRRRGADQPLRRRRRLRGPFLVADRRARHRGQQRRVRADDPRGKAGRAMVTFRRALSHAAWPAS